MEKAKIQLDLRNYLILNKIPIAFINFKESLLEERYDGSPFNENYQILVLEKPSPYALELEPLEWRYTAKKVLLLFGCSSKKISVIPLDFSVNLIGGENINDFYFSNYQSLKICEEHIMITSVGKELNGNHMCSDIALFTTEGRFIAVWKMENIEGNKVRIKDFYQLNDDHWLANFSIDEKIKYKPAVTRLCLLPLDKVEANRLSLIDDFHSKVGSLLSSKTSEISSWFSDKVDGISNFFVLASHYQCCIYHLPNEVGYSNNYFKVADITLENSFIDDVNVSLTDEGITVSFDNGRTLVKSGSFHFSFEK